MSGIALRYEDQIDHNQLVVPRLPGKLTVRRQNCARLAARAGYLLWFWSGWLGDEGRRQVLRSGEVQSG